MITLTVFIILSVLGFSGFIKFNQTKKMVKELFRLNKELQEQNYYMAEFEFKMLGIAYHLDKGNYSKSLLLIDTLYNQLKTKENLVKMPMFSSKKDELEFYLNLQNPTTGAFMDDTYPLSTYHGPTENVLLHIEALAKATGQPLKLKYPLKYLDEINTPKKLIAFLDDVSTVGFIASKFPQTSFHNARDILSLARDRENYDENKVDLIIQKHNLYNFTPEWKHTMLKWFYEAQDPKTGLWGPKSKNKELVKKDLNNSASIMKAFVDEQGNNIHKSFPLQYKETLFKSVLNTLLDPVPADNELDELHEWNLKMPKGIRLLTRYLWKDASRKNKEVARDLIENYIQIKCEKYYIPEEGSFSYYPNGIHASLDGTGSFSIFKEIGAFSSHQQTKLWGSPKENIQDLGLVETSEITQKDFDKIATAKGVNSLRFYKVTPDYNNLILDVFAIAYPKKTSVLDVIDFTQNIKHWIKTTPQTMGNWKSKASIIKYLENIKLSTTSAYKGSVPIKSANTIFHNNNNITIIGFDILQIPRYKIEFKPINNIS